MKQLLTIEQILANARSIAISAGDTVVRTQHIGLALQQSDDPLLRDVEKLFDFATFDQHQSNDVSKEIIFGEYKITSLVRILLLVAERCCTSHELPEHTAVGLRIAQLEMEDCYYVPQSFHRESIDSEAVVSFIEEWMSSNHTNKSTEYSQITSQLSFENFLSRTFDLLEEGQLAIISGSRASGKTALLLFAILRLLKKSWPCLVYSLRHSERHLKQLLLASLHKAPVYGIDNSESEINFSLNKLTVVDYDFDSCDNFFTDLESHLTGQHNKAVVINTFNNIVLQQFTNSQNSDDVQKWTYRFKEICRVYRCVGLIICPLDSNISFKEQVNSPTMFDIMYSRQWQAFSDLILLTRKPEAHGLEFSENGTPTNSKVEVNSALNRNGPIGSIIASTTMGWL